MHDRSEHEAIQSICAGDTEGLKFLYYAYSERVFRTCFRILGDYPLAEDSTQEVFLRIAERAHTFNGRSQVATWIYRVSVNHALNKLKKRNRREHLNRGLATSMNAAKVLPESPDRIAEARERRDEVHLMLGQVKDDYRIVLVLREIEDLSYREISDALQIPVGTVMSRLARARDAFKAVWLSRSKDGRE